MTQDLNTLKKKGLFSKVRETFSEIYHYRQMVYGLVHRELRGRYKASVLGFLWTFLNPLLQLLVYTVVFSYVLKSGIEHYFLFLFVALIPWIFFSASLTGGAESVVAQKDMVKKIYFPREVLPISSVTTNFVNMLLCFVVIFVVIAVCSLLGLQVLLPDGVTYVRVGFNLAALARLPIVMIVEYFMGLGVAMLASAITVYFRDLQHILGIGAMAWQFLTPVMYTVPENMRTYFMLNPMTPVIEAYRDILYYQRIPALHTLLSAVAFGVFFLILGFLVFGRLKRHFAEQF